MAYSTFIVRKANDFGVDLGEPAGVLWVCQRLLEGLWYRFGDDTRKVLQDINGIESELREVRNAFDTILFIRIEDVLEGAGHITSVKFVQQRVNAAYSLVCGASLALDNGITTAEVYTSVVNNLVSCRAHITDALKGFCTC